MRWSTLLFDAFSTLKSFKIQTLLTMVGVMIGCAALCSNVLVSRSASKMAETMIGEHQNAFVVHFGGSEAVQITPFSWPSYRQELPTDIQFSPISMVYAPLAVQGKKITGQTIATTAPFLKAHFPGVRVEGMEYPNRICWVGANIAVKIGDVISIGDTVCEVQVKLPKIAPSALLSFDLNQSVMIPYTALSRFSPQVKTDMVWGNATSSVSVLDPALKKHFNQVFGHNPRHWIDSAAILENVLSGIRLLQSALKMIGILAVVVGLLNLINLLLLVASMRQQEFAIRQVCGASVKSIATLLLTETSLILLASSILGIGVGLVSGSIICFWMYWPIFIEWRLLWAIPITLIVGAIAVFPAIWKVARKPVIALLNG
jgi:ABC-type antimicrobial peptide transport system permease subunit